MDAFPSRKGETRESRGQMTIQAFPFGTTARRGKPRFPLLGSEPYGLSSERRGYSTVVVHQLPKLATRVRFPLPAVCRDGSGKRREPRPKLTSVRPNRE